ncbi:MAG: sigma-70 family RNA polymerase sigma factor [Planctomycetota bacterium]|nr:sigma-70 family RNA polymerase sigma factor [Planctomycetota bacterium]
MDTEPPAPPAYGPDEDLAGLQAAGDDAEARSRELGDLLEKHRVRLLRMVELRMDPALKARIGASDVLQEANLEIATRLDAYLENPRMPFFLWVRFITAQRLLKLRRFHVSAQKRDARREISADAPMGPSASAVALVNHLMASGVTPSLAMAEGEFRTQLMAALDEMNPLDREVLVLRHFEELSNVDAARSLGIAPDAASKRYIRALERLAGVLKRYGASPGALGA